MDEVHTFKAVKAYPQLLDYTLGQLNDNINFLNANDKSHLWNDCVEFNLRLDKTRKQDFFAVTPEFKNYV